MRALLIQPVRLSGSTDDRDPEYALAEAASLVSALDVDLVGDLVVRLHKTDPGRLFGQGKVSEIKDLITTKDAHLVIVDGTLSPVQQRNLERAWQVKILDRTGLILEIFGKRAKTREGVLQVELAHYTYQKSRLVRSWTHLERQRGGGGFLGGPGETQIEADRRALDASINRLRKQLAKVTKTRALHRASRQKVPYPVVALVGYTNAGKSTLFNYLTDSDVLAKDMVFATLDPTMRSLDLPSGRSFILSDTVGFISDLPTQLVAAFRATLEEVLDADLILHVRDISHPETEMQRSNVMSILSELGADTEGGTTILEIWNKFDLLDAEQKHVVANIANRNPETLITSAVSGEGVERIAELIESSLFSNLKEEHVELPSTNGSARAWLFENNLVVCEQGTEYGQRLTVRWSPKERGRFKAMFPQALAH